MNKLKNKFLIIGPFPEPITGNSLANYVLKNGLKSQNEHVDIINMATQLSENIGKFSFKKFIHAVLKYFFLYKVFQNNVIYMTPGQTFLGVLKYFPFIVLSKILKRMVIIHIHGNFLWAEYEQSNILKKKVLKFSLGMADKGIVLSPTLKKNLTPFLEEKKIHIVHNFAEDFLHKKTKPKTFNYLKIIYLSNLMTEKGIFDVLKSFLYLQKAGVEFQAKVAGAIDRNVRAEVLGELAKVATDVEYLGVIKGVAKKELLEWSNVFVFPTYYHIEGQPIAMLEAMVTGNVIITTKHAGIPDIVDESNAFFVNNKSAEEICNILTLFYKNKMEFVRKSSRNLKSSKNFTEKQFVKNIIKVVNG